MDKKQTILKTLRGIALALALMTAAAAGVRAQTPPPVPNILMHPQPQTVSEHGTAQFSISVIETGGLKCSYTWYWSSDGGATWNRINNDAWFSDAATPNLTFTGVGMAWNGRLFRCSVSNSSAFVVSQSAKLTVIPVPVISLVNSSDAPFTAHTFPAQTAGYSGSSSTFAIFVKNTGGSATGAITIALEGANRTDFTLNRSGMSSVAAGAKSSESFIISHNPYLSAGTYTATAKVTGANGGSATFTVSFTVNPATPVISLVTADDAAYTSYTFGSPTEGYSGATTINVFVRNTGVGSATGTITVALEGANRTAFTLDRTSMSSVAAGAKSSESIGISYKTGLSIGTYNATVRVTGANGGSATITVRLEVIRVGAIISLVNSGDAAYTSHTFAPQTAGYGSTANSDLIFLRNTGGSATGAITIALSGANPGAFTLSRDGMNGVVAGSRSIESFRVSYKNGLAAGTYTAVATVTGYYGGSATFTVSFTVNPAPVIALISSSGAAYASYTFPAQTAGYGYPDFNYAIYVQNTSAVATGVITIALSGANPAAFSLTRTSMASVGAGARSSESFQIFYDPGLAAGTYAATATVTGANGGSATFTVSLTVHPGAATPVITITTQPQPVTVTQGAITGSLTVAATITQGATLSYQWHEVRPLQKPIAVSGATSASFPIPATLTAGTYDYYCEVSVGGGATTVNSATARVTVVNGGGTPTYSINASPASPSFGTLQSPYTQPAAQTVTITNTGTGDVTLDALPTVANYTLTAISGFGGATFGPTKVASFTIRPVAGLPAGTYNPTFNITGSNGVSVAISPTFTVTAAATVAVTGVTVSPTTLSGTVGGSGSLTATVQPANATNRNVTWTTSNASVATVSAAGVVNYVAAGTATVTATTVDGSRTASCAVTVTAATAPTYAVTVNGGTGGGNYPAGATVGITANAPAAGKEFDRWTTASAGVSFASATSASTTFTMPASAVAVTATYKDLPVTPTMYTVYFDADGGSPAPASQTVTAGSRLTEPTAPTRNSYLFKGWYDGAYRWNFATDAVNGNMTLKAGWDVDTGNEAVLPPTLKAWTVGGALYADGLTAGETLSVYSLTGVLIYSGVADDTGTQRIASLPARGVYIIRHAGQTAKAVN